MTGPSKWFERKFEFVIPVEHLPNLCSRLHGTPARLEDLVRGHSPEELTARIGQKWSIQEHAGHLLDLESLWNERVSDYLAGTGKLTVADLNNSQTNEANHNARPLTMILDQFRQSRFQLLDRVERLEPDVLSRTLTHPRLQQPMRLIDHLYFVAEHDDHHLARIWEMLSTGVES